MAWWAAASAVAKKMVVAEATNQAVQRSNSVITPAIAIAIEGLGITLFSLTAIATVGAMNFSVMGLMGDIPGVGHLMSNTTTGDSKAAGQKIADAAITWVGKDFNPGVTAQCAFFVRQVFEDAGIDIGVAKGAAFSGGSYASAGFAGSFFSDEIGAKVERNQLQPGDLVAFKDTYGSFPPGTITHVGIYVGNGMMVDRSTSSMPVYHRSIDTFGDKFMFGVRPYIYAEMSTSAHAGDSDAKFEVAYRFSAKWEGDGCSNHPADIGGYTCYGVAQNYSSSDVGSLGKEGAKAEIKKRFWDATNCGQYDTALAVVCLDTHLNFGSWDWLTSSTGLNAQAIVKGRKAYRYQRVAEAPSQRVFLQGWLNRDNALEQYIGGLR